MARIGGSIWSTEKTLSFWRRTNGCDAQDTSVVDFDHRDQSDPTLRGALSGRLRPPQGHRKPDCNAGLPDRIEQRGQIEIERIVERQQRA